MREQRAGKDASGETGDGVGLLLQIPHNGEINTIRGNADRMLAREETIASPVMDGDMDKILPVVDQGGFGSSMLDNTLEFLMMNGMELPQAVMLCIPEPWARDRRMDREKRDFSHYYATMMEPWDGPAAIVFSDGDTVGAVLDRNGLRPCRWYLTGDADSPAGRCPAALGTDHTEPRRCW